MRQALADFDRLRADVKHLTRHLLQQGEVDEARRERLEKGLRKTAQVEERQAAQLEEYRKISDWVGEMKAEI